MDNIRCAVRGFTDFPSFLGCGWGRGYVCVNDKHPLFGKDYRELEFEVHGGLTFGGNLASVGYGKFIDKLDWLDSMPEQPNLWWIFGFDTAHYNDTLEEWDEEAVIAETRRLAEQFRGWEPKKLEEPAPTLLLPEPLQI